MKWTDSSVPVSKGKQRTGRSEGGLWGRKHHATQKMRGGAEKTLEGGVGFDFG